MIVLMTMTLKVIDYINSFHSFLSNVQLRPKQSHRSPCPALARRSIFDIPCSTFDIHRAPPLITFPSHFDGQFSRLKL